MSLNGYAWVSGNTPNNTDPSGMQDVSIPTLPIDWDAALREAIERVNRNPGLLDEAVWSEAIREALQSRGIVATPQLIAQGLARLSAAGVFAGALIPRQWPDGRVCNVWDYQLGTCFNPSIQAPAFGWQPFDQGNSCALLPLLQSSPRVAPYVTPPGVGNTNQQSNEINMDTVSAQTFTTADPAAAGAKALILTYTVGKQIVMTETALAEFYGQLGTVAGSTERITSNTFLMNVTRILDNPSERVSNLRETGSVGRNDKIIFGTADRLGIVTITADERFLRGAFAQGVDLYPQVLLHQPYHFIGQ